MGGDCRDKTKPDSTTQACPAGANFAEVHEPPPKPKPTSTPVEAPVYLAQATGGQVSGIPHYGNVAPIAKDKIVPLAIDRQNQDHGATGPALPAGGTTLPEQRRAAEGAAALQRANATRLANQRELERSPLGVLDAAVTGGVSTIGTEALVSGNRYRQFRGVSASFAADQRALAAMEATPLATGATRPAAYTRLQNRIESFEKLRIGQPKNVPEYGTAQTEMARLESEMRAGRTAATGFTADEIKRMARLQQAEGYRFADKGDFADDARFTALRGSLRGGVGRLTRGIAGATGTYWGDRFLSSNAAASGHDQLAEFLNPSKLEIAAMGATWTMPTPEFVPGAGGPWYARLGARALFEGTTWLTTKGAAFVWDKWTDPDVEKGHLAEAKQAQAADHAAKTPDSMNAAINAWKKLGEHDNQIYQVLNDTMSQVGTTNAADLAQTRRDLVAMYAANGEARLDNGTRVGGPDLSGKPIPGGPDKVHFILAGHNYDFGGMAMYNLNTARNVMNELGIPATDPVAKQVYSSLSESYMSRIMNPHSDLPKVYDELKGLVQKKDPDATWLSGWLPTQIANEKDLMAKEESASMAAKRDGKPFTPQFNNYVLAKVYQDQALLEMAYADTGTGDKVAHMKVAHDALAEAQRLGWTGREIKVNGVVQTRQGDLTQLVTMYKGLGGTVDW